MGRVTAADVVALLDRLEGAGICVWIDGGWGVDALVGRETRPHSDLDLVLAHDDAARAQDVLAEFAHAIDKVPGLPTRLVLRDGAGRQIDFHLVSFDERGDAWQELPDGGRARYPAEDLQAVGTIDGHRVRCISAGLQRAHHTGYEPTELDLRDMRLLSELA